MREAHQTSQHVQPVAWAISKVHRRSVGMGREQAQRNGAHARRILIGVCRGDASAFRFARAEVFRFARASRMRATGQGDKYRVVIFLEVWHRRAIEAAAGRIAVPVRITCRHSFVCQTRPCAFGGTLMRALRARVPTAPQARLVPLAPKATTARRSCNGRWHWGGDRVQGRGQCGRPPRASSRPRWPDDAKKPSQKHETVFASLPTKLPATGSVGGPEEQTRLPCRSHAGRVREA
jgi:hypothetical protein